jgi:hypothetical protein
VHGKGNFILQVMIFKNGCGKRIKAVNRHITENGILTKRQKWF